MNTISQNNIQHIKKIVFSHIDTSKYQVFVFGSRATGSEKQWSDIDIGIEGPDEVSKIAFGRMKNELDESTLPYTVDIVDFSSVSARFKEVAKKSIIPLN